MPYIEHQKILDATNEIRNNSSRSEALLALEKANLAAERARDDLLELMEYLDLFNAYMLECNEEVESVLEILEDYANEA